MKISDFVSKLNGGLARTSRFTVNMIPPSAIKLPGVLPNETIMMFCDKVQIPAISVNTTPIRAYGEVRETPYEFNYEPITISFYVDTKLAVKTFFDDWVKSLQNGRRRTFNYYDDYICKQMQIHVEDTLDQKQYTVELFEVYPKSVGAIELDYASKDVMKINVTLMFKYWEASRGISDKGTRNNPMNDPKMPFGLPNLPSSALKIPKFF